MSGETYEILALCYSFGVVAVCISIVGLSWDNGWWMYVRAIVGGFLWPLLLVAALGWWLYSLTRRK